MMTYPSPAWSEIDCGARGTSEVVVAFASAGEPTLVPFAATTVTRYVVMR